MKKKNEMTLSQNTSQACNNEKENSQKKLDKKIKQITKVVM